MPILLTCVKLSMHIMFLSLTMQIHVTVFQLSSVASYTLDHKGKQWKVVLKEWLSLFRLLRNPKVFYKGLFFREVLQYRLVT